MGTKWRGLLALQNEPTADGRRFKALSTRTLPLGLKWQRVDAMGHDDSVVVGSQETANLGTTAQAVEAGWISAGLAAESKLDAEAVGLWGSGELFDDIDAEAMPRLAEDVAEAVTLLDKRVIAPSIDAIAVGAVLMVEPGEDEPPSEERLDELFEAWMETGAEPEFEILLEEGLVAAATLVVTPAFSEVRPFELLTGEPAGGEETPEDADAATQRAMALVAAVPPRPPADLFADPQFTAYTEIHVVRRDDGLLQVLGHFAPGDSCHLAFRDACVAPPTTAAAYVPFHRHVVELADGTLLGVGRITTGFGRVGTGCSHGGCRGKDDHACESMSMAQAIAHHDQQTPLAWVRAGEDEHGLYVVGVADNDLTAAGLALLEGRKFSGDWREHGAGLELVELLALAKGAPAFPAPKAYMRDGRQASLVASYRPPLDRPSQGGDYRRQLARSVADMVVADLRAAGLAVATAHPELDNIGAAAVTAAATEDTGAMVALVPAEADAGRLVADGGAPPGDLHLPLVHLGDAAQYDSSARNAIIGQVWDLASQAGPAVAGEVTSASEVEGLSVLAVGGDQVDAVRGVVTTGLAGLVELPDTPASAVILLGATPLSADNTYTGPVTFDRLRVQFGADVTEILLSPEPVDESAALLAELQAACDAPAAAALLRELEEVSA